MKNAFKKIADAVEVSEELDYSSIAGELFAADKGTREEIAAAEAAIVRAKSNQLDRIKAVAEQYPLISEETFDAFVTADLKKAYTDGGYKDAATRVAMVKVAFIAFAHGIEPDEEHASNIQNFVNKQARTELQSQEIIKATGKGRKSGGTSEKVKDQRYLACLLLAGQGDPGKDVAEARAKLLYRATTAGNWKLLEKMLAGQKSFQA